MHKSEKKGVGSHYTMEAACYVHVYTVVYVPSVWIDLDKQLPGHLASGGRRSESPPFTVNSVFLSLRFQAFKAGTMNSCENCP